jgi:hypothetical protein
MLVKIKTRLTHGSTQILKKIICRIEEFCNGFKMGKLQKQEHANFASKARL